MSTPNVFLLGLRGSPDNPDGARVIGPITFNVTSQTAAVITDLSADQRNFGSLSSLRCIQFSLSNATSPVLLIFSSGQRVVLYAGNGQMQFVNVLQPNPIRFSAQLAQNTAGVTLTMYLLNEYQRRIF